MFRRSTFLLYLLITHLSSATTPDLDRSSAESIARRHIAERLAEKGFQPADYSLARLNDMVFSAHNGATHLYFRQVLHGVDVRDGNLTISLDRRGRVLGMEGAFFPGLASRDLEARPPIPPRDAVRIATEAVGMPPPHVPKSYGTSARDTRTVLTFNDGTPSATATPAKLIYLVDETCGTPRLAWEIGVVPHDRRHAWLVAVDAHGGAVLDCDDHVRRASYRVFELPRRWPDGLPRTLQVEPHDPVASPFGWHDSNGSTGPEFTTTRGNNVIVQEDIDADNAGGFRPDGGTELLFDFPLNLNGPPQGNQSASVTQAFYVCNKMHDVLYRYGFDEAAGNFQLNNYGGGGADGDPVIVDVLDGDMVGNARFTHDFMPDGNSPRISLGRFVKLIQAEVTHPASLAGLVIDASVSLFGSNLSTPISGRVVQAIDEGVVSTDACNAIDNAADLSGNIALIDRGECFFTEKVKNAQDAGAIAAIVVNNVGDELVTMVGEDPEITIPSLFIKQSDGNAIKAELVNGVELTAQGEGNLNTAFDTEIVVHEYCHGISLRLTGGRMDSNCLDNLQPEALAEGWSDWFALVATVAPSDFPETPRTFGSYSVEDGLRRYPYSTDLAINPQTFGNLDDTGPHDNGEIWCSALWEMFWNLVGVHGYDPDLFTGSGGNNIAIQLVVDGMKMQPCEPTFLEARDAILLADQVNNAGDNQCLIWEAFAKRGMGAAAMSGGSDSSTTTEDFTIPTSCASPRISYADWQAVTFPPGTPAEDMLETSDPDEDDLPNALECYHGLNPLGYDPSPFESARQGDYVIVRYPRRRGIQSLAFVEWSQDLEEWSRYGVTRSVSEVQDETEQIEALVPFGFDRVFSKLVVP